MRYAMLRALYLTNAALLVVHELDSTFWHEWNLFRLPGGEPAFVLLHLPLVALVVWGYARLDAGAHSGVVMSLVLGAAGILASALHAIFLAMGRPEFRTEVSLAVLVATGLVSLVQVATAARALRPARGQLTTARPSTTPRGTPGP